MIVRHNKIAVFVTRAGADRGTHEFLQLHRAPGDEIGGTWQTVRGTIEGGETAVQAGLRELGEETRLTPREFYRLGSVETFYDAADDAIVHSVPFLALVERDAKIVLNEEHDAVRWVAAAEADHFFMWPSEKPLLKEIRTEFLPDGACKPLLLIRP
jgi:8-oxo-dGTP pyrophosphatase MutT (NUDIX family)